MNKSDSQFNQHQLIVKTYFFNGETMEFTSDIEIIEDYIILYGKEITLGKLLKNLKEYEELNSN